MSTRVFGDDAIQITEGGFENGVLVMGEPFTATAAAIAHENEYDTEICDALDRLVDHETDEETLGGGAAGTFVFRRAEAA